jgi:hypothetical protein
MKTLIAAALMLACVTAQGRSFNSIIRAQEDPQETSAEAEAADAAAAEAAQAESQGCANPPASVVDVIVALLSGTECEGVSTLSNIDTALQLGPR